jgi:hypothetical protein
MIRSISWNPLRKWPKCMNKSYWTFVDGYILSGNVPTGWIPLYFHRLCPTGRRREWRHIPNILRIVNAGRMSVGRGHHHQIFWMPNGIQVSSAASMQQWWAGEDHPLTASTRVRRLHRNSRATSLSISQQRCLATLIYYAPIHRNLAYDVTVVMWVLIICRRVMSANN